MATFIFHGVSGNPGENWFPWLKAELEKIGERAIVPAFPHADEPKLNEWIAHMKQYDADLNEETILIGHSLGAAFALRLPESMQQPIRSTILVAPVWGIMGNEFDARMTTFTVQPYDWERIHRQCGTFSIFQSDNDPYIEVVKTEQLAKNLATSVTMVPGAGHFNSGAGYTQFPALLKLLLKNE